jgi:acyl-CoA synthetase (AMP-forming)/AMP-acid ligase II
MITHANMVSVTRMTIDYLHYTEADRILCVLPLAHSYGLYQLFEAFMVGGSVVLEKNFAFPARAIGLLEKEGITAFPGSPTIYALLLKYRNLLEKPLPALRTMTNAASALPTSHINQLRAMFPNVRIVSMYGQSECKRVCYLPPEELDQRPDSVGIAIPNTEVYIVDEDGERVRAGEVGELVVRGSHVARGYWRAPELTAQRFRPGPTPGEIVLYTGDLFRTDEQGYLYFVSRKDDIIKSRGEKVSPREIENVVCHLPGIAESAVVGVPDPLLGQAILLVVTTEEQAQLTERDVRAHCARHLEDYMQPKYVEFAADLPRTDNGKINKRAIAAEFAATCAAS